jgi:hypothetical protein
VDLSALTPRHAGGMISAWSLFEFGGECAAMRFRHSWIAGIAGTLRLADR